MKKLYVKFEENVVFDVLGDAAIQVLDLGIELTQGLFDRMADGLELDLLQASALGAAHLHELAATAHHFVEFGPVFRSSVGGPRFHPPSELGQEAAVDAVVLGKPVQGPGKVAALPWVDQGHGKPAVHQVQRAASLVSAGVFDDDELDAHGPELLADRANRCLEQKGRFPY